MIAGDVAPVAGPAVAVLSYVGTFVAGGLVGAITTVATFRSAVAVLERASADQAQQLGALGGRHEDLRRDVNAIASKWRDQLDTHKSAVAREIRAALRRDGSTSS